MPHPLFACPPRAVRQFLVTALIAAFATAASAEDVVIADFESESYGEWRAAGDAFGPGPAQGALPGQMPVSGFQGEGLVNSFHGGDSSTGTLTSPPVKITAPFLNFLIGGGGYERETCIDLRVDGQIVRSATGPNGQPGGSEALRWHSWDVAEFVGRQAEIQIVDRRRGGWGHINVDQIVLSDRRIEAEPAVHHFVAEKRYLHLPVKTGAAKRRLKLLSGGTAVREMDVELAAGAEPSLVAAVDLTAWQGETLTLDAGKIVGGAEKAFAGLTQSDHLPNHQNIYAEEHRPQFHFTSKNRLAQRSQRAGPRRRAVAPVLSTQSLRLELGQHALGARRQRRPGALERTR